MKRRLVGIALLLVLLAVGAIVVASFSVGSIIKKGVETAGPKITKVTVKLESASLAVLSGSGELRGLLVGNPEGFKTPSAIQIGSIAVTVSPRSVFSDKVVVHSIAV